MDVTESKISSTILKVKEIGYTDYFSEPWDGELKFGSYREISEFLLNVSLFGDEKLFDDSISAIKTVLYQNPEHDEAQYFRFVAKGLARSDDWRAVAVGMSLISLSDNPDEKALFLQKARDIIISEEVRDTFFPNVANEAALSIIYDSGSDIDKENALDALLLSSDGTKRHAIESLDVGNGPGSRILAALIDDKNRHVASYAAEKLYLNVDHIKKEDFDEISQKAIKTFTAQEQATNVAGSDRLHNLGGLVIAASMYASAKALGGYLPTAIDLVKKNDPYQFGIGYALMERLLARGLTEKTDVPDEFYSRMNDFEFFKAAYNISVMSSGARYNQMEAYRSYMQKMKLLFEEGKITEKAYEKMQSLQADIEKNVNNTKKNAHMMFGILDAGRMPNSKNGQDKSVISVLRRKTINTIDTFILQTAVDNVLINEIQWQLRLSEKIPKYSKSGNEYKAYWNMLRYGLKTSYKAAKDAYSHAVESRIFPDYIVKGMQMETIMSAKVSMAENRFYLMHETDPEARFLAMERLAARLSNLNKEIIGTIESYAKENGVVPNEYYMQNYESLVSSNEKQIEQIKARLRK
jgi:hypothetical protein